MSNTTVTLEVARPVGLIFALEDGLERSLDMAESALDQRLANVARFHLRDSADLVDVITQAAPQAPGYGDWGQGGRAQRLTRRLGTLQDRHTALAAELAAEVAA